MSLVTNLRCFPMKQLFCSLATTNSGVVIFSKHSIFFQNRIKINNFASQISRLHGRKCPVIISQLSSLFSSRKAAVLTFVRGNAKSFYDSSGADINTNVSKDVIIYEYKNDRFFKTLKIFALVQIIVWGYLAETCYTTLRDAPVEKPEHRELKWWETINFGENWVRNGITIMCLCMGLGMASFAYMFSARTVKKVILHKGGRDITIQNFTPFGNNNLKVPLTMVSCKISQTTKPRHLPLKVKGRMLYFTLDNKGTYPHPTLFEWTAGLKRKL